MKKQLSFILALVLVLTLAFGIVPVARATVALPEQNVGTLTVTKSQARGSADIAPEQEFTVYVWFEKNIDIMQVDDSSNGTWEKLDTPVDIHGDGIPIEYQWKLDLNVGEFVKFINVNTSKWKDNDFKFFEVSPGTDWDVSYSNARTVNGDENETATVYNKYTPPFGTLTVEKDVTTDKAPAAGVAFPISVQFKLPEGQGEAEYLSIANNLGLTPMSDGAYTFTLEDNTSVIFSNVPKGTTYTVIEDDMMEDWALEGYWDNDMKNGDSKTDGAGEITNSCENDTVTVKNKYTKGMLEITKKVLTTNAPAMQFPITVTFDNKAGLNGITSIPSATPDPEIPGKYSFNLADGEIIKFYGIPTDTTYTVREVLANDNEWAVTYDDENNGGSDNGHNGIGIIKNAGTYDTVKVKNEYKLGILTVMKDIPRDAPTNVPFPVTVVFRGEDFSTIIPPVGAVITTPGTYTFNLNGGSSATFYGIPHNTVYTYSEDLSDTNYDAAGWSFKEFNDEDYDGFKDKDKSDNGKGKIDECGDSDTVKLKNNYCPPDTGKIEITKLVTGENDVLDPDFIINITFSHVNPLMYLGGITTTGAVTGSNGIYVATLGKGDTAKFNNIPVGTTYVVSESTTLLTGYTHDPINDIDNDDSHLEPNNIDGKNDIDKITVTNHFIMPTGTLTVDKDVNQGAPTNVPFTFTVVFTGYGLDAIEPSYEENEDENDGEDESSQLRAMVVMSPDTKTFTFTMTAADDPVSFMNIPLDATYVITEAKELPNNWAYVSGDTTEGSFDRTNLTDTVTFLNNYTAPYTPPPPADNPPVNPGDNSGVLGIQEVEPEPSEEPSPEPGEAEESTAVAGDAILPQTGGVSLSTFLGIFGLALIALGGTVFVIMRKKFLN